MSVPCFNKSSPFLKLTFISLSLFLIKQEFFFPLCHIGVQVIAAADEVVGSIDKEELAKYLSLNSDPEDEEAQVTIVLPPFEVFRFVSASLYQQLLY